MITLRPMLPENLEPYLRIRSETYAVECVESGFWLPDRAVERAYSYFKSMLPFGINTPNHHFFTVHEDKTEVGNLWFCILHQQDIKSAFVCHIEIFQQFRRRGYAKKAFEQMETIARNLGATCLSLSVFTQNRGAQQFYQQMGFLTPGINMLKQI